MRRFTMFLALSLTFFLSSAARAKFEGIDLRLTDASITQIDGEFTAESRIVLDCIYTTWGWSYGVCHPSAYTVEDVRLGETALTINDGDPPDWVQTEIYAGGFTQGAVISFVGTAVLPPGSDYELAIATYSTPNPEPGSLCFCSGLGDPPVAVVIVIADASQAPEQHCGEFIFSEEFIRGDCSRDSTVDIGDPIETLEYLFGDDDTGGCLDACDANDDGAVDIADAVGMLAFLFSGGEPFPAPFPGCGDDLTADTLDCNPVDACP